MDPIRGKSVQKIKLDQNEAAMSVCLLKFNSQPDATFCLVGVAKDYKLNPRSVGGGFVYAYRMVPSPLGQPNMELVHKTVLDEIPYSMCAFQGKVLIGVGKLLRLYDLGKKKMLRKSENKHIPHIIVGIQSSAIALLYPMFKKASILLNIAEEKTSWSYLLTTPRQGG